MSILARFTLIDRGKVRQSMIREYDTLAEAELDAHDGMDLFSTTNPQAMWVQMEILDNASLRDETHPDSD